MSIRKLGGLAAGALLLGSVTTPVTAQAQDYSPPPAPLCVVDSGEFASWKSTEYPDGLSFSPPNSATFTASDGDCSFYKWSARMFLWLTSRDGAGNYVMFSPTFYAAVENPGSNNGFSYFQNSPTLEAGANGLKKPEISFNVRVNKPEKSLMQAAADTTPDSTGQAGGGGALILNGDPVPVPGSSTHATYPVVYYSLLVNDVYVGLADNTASVAYYNSGSNAGNFPITKDQATEIQTAANASYSDLDQLALEIKNSWVDTAYLTSAQAAGLLQIEGDVPAFTSSTVDGKLVLTWDGTTLTTRTLALVGTHVVGSVANHPEMIWATFEANANTPDTTYAYLNTDYNAAKQTCNSGMNCVTTVSFTGQPSIFYNGSTTTPPTAITETAKSADHSTTITSTGSTLIATEVVRLNPWGNVQPATPTVTDSTVINNTMLMSLQTSLDPQFGDTHFANYFQLGSLWTNGIIPSLSGYEEAGSKALANSTMETFQQTPAFFTGGPTGCFKCHSISSGDGTAISHIFTPSN